MNGTRKQCRSGSPCAPATPAEALNCLVQHGVLTVGELADQLATRHDIHVSRAQLYDWSNPYAPAGALALPFRVLVALTEITRNPIVLEVLGRQIGYRVDPLPMPDHAAAVEREFLDVSVGHGKLAEAVRMATDDGQISDVERGVLRVVVCDQKRQLAELEAAIETPAPGRGPR